jgi:hypothetical protein
MSCGVQVELKLNFQAAMITQQYTKRWNSTQNGLR